MDATKLIEEVTGLIGKLPALPWRQAPKQCGHTRCDCPLMQNYVRDAQDRTVFAVALEGSTDWKMRRMEGEIAAVLARLVSCVPELIAALKASEEQARKAEELAAANLAANKRIVELEQETDRLITQRDRWEEQVGDMAASAGCEEEFSNWHDHKDCVEECVAVLKTERDAARTELARLTTPRPIAEAPTDKPVLGIWIDHRGNKCFEVLRWDGRWMGALGTPLYREAEYLPMPEVKP